MTLPSTYLFVPGNRPDRFDKALASRAGAIIVDLEDAVAPADKALARASFAGWYRSARFAPERVLLRINDENTGWFTDDMALVRALKEGWIAGAGLDVMPQEPPPSTHPIFDCPNVVMSAHTSGWSPDRQVRLIDLFADNVRRYAGGIPLINVVDKEKGY